MEQKILDTILYDDDNYGEENRNNFFSNMDDIVVDLHKMQN